jgi:hypothetical protein
MLNFTPIKLMAAIFTPEFAFGDNLFLINLFNDLSERKFNGEFISVPIPQDAPAELPWYSNFPFARKCFQDLSVGDIGSSKCNIYNSLLNSYLLGYPKYLAAYRLFSSQVDYKNISRL